MLASGTPERLGLCVVDGRSKNYMPLLLFYVSEVGSQ